VSIKTIFAICALVGIVWIVAVNSGSADEAKPRSVTVAHREVPDDAPGRPAQPVPGATPAKPIFLGIASTYQVNVDSVGANIPGDAANEPSIAVDPTNPNFMAIGWRQFDTVLSNFRQAGWGYTTDGGRTWTFPGVIEPGVFRSDPVLAFDAEGNFFYNSLKVVGSVFSCQIFESNDGGQSWGLPVEAFGGDKQWMAIDRTGGSGHGNIYQAWNTAAGCCGDTTFNRSTDDGASFDHPVRIPNTPIFGTLDFDADGNVYVVGVRPGVYSDFYVAKSSNAKDPLVTPTFDWSTWVWMNGSMSLYDPPNPEGLMGQADIAVDRSGGPHHGNIYVLCSVDPPGNDPLDIHFIRSTDGGQTWTLPPIRINDDPLSPYGYQWFGTMSVAPNGRIDVVWNDTRGIAGGTASYLYYSFSTDGGLNWATNQRLSPLFYTTVGWPQQNKIGDYYDMVSDDVGASLAWAATFNEEQDLYYTRIGGYDCNVNGVPDSVDIATGQSGDSNENGIPDECEGIQTAVGDSPSAAWRLHQNVPNPFNPSTTIRFAVPDGGGRVTLRVYDVQGRLVRTLVDGFEGAGEVFVEWDGRGAGGQAVASGLYFYRLDTSTVTLTRKMLLLK